MQTPSPGSPSPSEPAAPSAAGRRPLSVQQRERWMFRCEHCREEFSHSGSIHKRTKCGCGESWCHQLPAGWHWYGPTKFDPPHWDKLRIQRTRSAGHRGALMFGGAAIALGVRRGEVACA